MDLADLLDDLLRRTSGTTKRQMRVVAKRTRRLRRRVRRAVRRGATAAAAALGVIGVLLLTLVSGGFAVVMGILSLVGAAINGAIAGIAHLADRRDPEVQAERARRKGLPTPAALDEDLTELPRDIHRDWSRLLLARRLVADLSRDGWVEGAAMLEVDGLVARMHRVLVAEQRAVAVGGTPSPELRRQVADLADLLVALADEAVKSQVEETTPSPALGTTLADARDHLVALREARREVGGLDA